MDILPEFPLWSSIDSGREDLLGLERLCLGFLEPDTLLLSVQSALCSDAWPRKCSIGEIIVQFTFLCAFSPQLGAAHMGYPWFFPVPRDCWHTSEGLLFQDMFRELCSCLVACASCLSSSGF